MDAADALDIFADCQRPLALTRPGLELLEQLDMLPELVRAMGFAAAKGAGYEADDFLAAAVASESEPAGWGLVRVPAPARELVTGWAAA